MRRIGHRGARGHAPDNTIASFQKALELGCDEVETDVWLIDGAIVISHDRPASLTGLLTLDQVLDLCAGKMGVDVEIKCAGSEDAARASGRAVARAIAGRRDPSVYVSSFWWDALLASRDAAPEVRCAYVYASSPERSSLLAGAKREGLWGLHPNKTYATADLVRAAHEAELAVQVWTVNEPREIEHFVALGVDGICSDYPERVPK